MSVRTERVERLIASLADVGAETVLVTDLINVRYLTGYTGSNGVALIGPDTRLSVLSRPGADAAARDGDDDRDMKQFEDFDEQDW